MRVLIVDDLPLNRKLLRAILASAGHETAEAGDGREALEALRQSAFDVVVTDILMPGMDGYRLCSEMRQSEDFRRIPIVVYTSTYTSPADEKMAMRVGADRFLRKPATPAEILGVLESVASEPRPTSGGESLQDAATIREYSDVLVRKLEEKNLDLETSERRIRELVDFSPIGICQSTPEGVLTSANSAAAAMLGYGSPEELVGLNMPREVYFDPADRAGVVAGFARGERDVEVQWKRKDGSPIWVQLDGRIARDESGGETHHEAFVRDVSARKRAEAESERSMAESTGLHRRKVAIDILVMAVVAGLVAYIDHQYGLFDGVVKWMLAHEPGPYDEILTAVIVLSVLGGVFSFRRWRDMRLETRSREQTERALRLLRTDLENRVEARTAELQADIAQRKVAEDSLAASEVRYRRLFEAARDGILILDFETGRITDANPFLSELLGFSRDEMIGKTVGELSPFRDLAANEIMLDRLQEREYIRYEDLPLETKDGRKSAVEFVSNVYDVGGQKVIQCNIRDITERKRAENGIRASEERVRVLMENAKDAIFVNSPDGMIVGCNRAAESLLGRPRSEIVGSSVAEIVAPEERERVGRSIAATVSTGSVDGFETFLLKSDGVKVPVEVSASLVEVAGEKVIHAIVRDATERKRLEEQYRHAQKMEAVGRLAGGIAHDFNNLLMVVQSFVDVLPLHLGDEKAVRHDLDQLRSTAGRGASLTRQLLAFSRKQLVRTETLDVKNVAAEMASLLEKLLGEDVQLEIRLDPSPCLVKADRGQIEQVLMNLAVNARDAMPRGGKIVIDVRPEQLDESFAATHSGLTPGSFVRASVSDTGTGISAEVRKHLFEPFFTTKESGRGTGLGLATVYGIVKAAGGDVWVYSEPGKGSVFNVYLPRVDRAGEPSRHEPAGASVTRGSETIFLVEDEDVIREMVREYLGAKGYTVHAAGSGHDAIRQASALREPIDLLLTDIVLPGPNGREVSEALSRSRPTMKTIFMSGYVDDAQTVGQILSEGRDFIQKPIGLEALARKIREILDR